MIAGNKKLIMIMMMMKGKKKKNVKVRKIIKMIK